MAEVHDRAGKALLADDEGYPRVGAGQGHRSPYQRIPILPTVAEIRSRAEALYKAAQGAESPDAGRGWGEVVREISRTGCYSKPKIKDPTAAEVVRRMGWKEICASPANETGVLRGQFMKMYAMLQTSREEERHNRALLQDGKVKGYIASLSGSMALEGGKQK